MLTRIACVVLAVLVVPLTTIAGPLPLADKVPADAVMYVGWGGVEAMGAEFKGSHFKAVLDATDWKQIFDSFLPNLAKRIGEKEPDGAKVVEAFSTLGEAMWKHPSAIYFGGIDFTDPKKPMPRIAFLVDAGAANNPKLADKLGGLMKAIHEKQEPPVPMAIRNFGAGPVALVIGDLPDSFNAMLGGPQAVAPGKALAQNDAFTKSTATLHKSPAAVIFMDGASFVKQIDAGVAASNDREAMDMWPKIRDALGLAGFKQFTWAGGFDGKDWTSAAFLSAPAPRTGLLSLVDGKPVPDDLLKRIPATATLMGAGSCDISKTITEISTAGGKVNPQIRGAIEGGLGMISGMIGIDAQKDLLDPLGDQWVYFVDPMIGGSTFAGFTLINRLDDAEKFSQSLNQFEQAFNGVLKAQLEGKDMTIEIRTRETNGLTLHYAALPMVTPTWTIKDGHLYVALFPQMVIAAANHDPAKAKSILDNASFATLRKRLGDGATKASSIQYLDLPKLAPGNYAIWLVFSRYFGFADIFGVESPLMLLPTMPDLMPHLAPAGSVAWADDAGWHMRHLTPFPGSEVLGTDPISGYIMVMPAVVTGVMVPSLNRARETANRVKSASNLRQIGQGLLLYANENKGKYPPNLKALIETQELAPVVLDSPLGDAPGGDYVYLFYAGMNSSIGPEVLVAYDAAALAKGEGTNLLFGDGHVEWVPKLALEQYIAASREAEARSAPGFKP